MTTMRMRTRRTRMRMRKTSYDQVGILYVYTYLAYINPTGA